MSSYRQFRSEFPGEGVREFGNTLSVAAFVPFSFFHVFSYSQRPGTAAMRRQDRVPRATIKARSRTLSELSRAKRLRFYQAHTGRTVKVLFEEMDAQGLYRGLTGSYIRTGVAASEPLTNSLRDVVITAATDGLALGHLADAAVKTLPMVAV